MNDHEYLKMTMELASKGIGHTSPNPLVGCVVVKDGEILATGYHAKVGSDHAERDALRKLNFKAPGATLYCNLEPCCHTNKRTPPCVPMIIEAGIKKVVFINIDPNPEVSLEGKRQLEASGIEVVYGIFEKEGQKQNERFFHFIKNNTPFIEAKIAMTLDGKIALNNGQSKWITSSGARQMGHERRSLYDAIVVGANTIREDNPTLSIRLNGTTRYVPRIIFTNSGNLPSDSTVFNDENAAQTYIVSSKPVGFWPIEKTFIFSGKINWSEFYQWLFSKKIYSLFIEGGAEIFQFFLEAKQIHRLSIFVAPKIMGKGKSFTDKIVHENIHSLIELKEIETQLIDDNIYYTGLL